MPKKGPTFRQTFELFEINDKDIFLTAFCEMREKTHLLISVTNLKISVSLRKLSLAFVSECLRSSLS